MTAAQEAARAETLLWSGAPRQGVFLRPTDLFLIPFSVLWAGFAVFWEVSVLTTSAPGFFALWGIPFVIMGIYITVGRFFTDAYRRRKTSYALTATRIVIRSGTTTQSLDLATLPSISLKEHRSGLGTITLGSSPFPIAFASPGWPGMKGPPEFDQIPDARRVYDQIREAQHQAHNSRVV